MVQQTQGGLLNSGNHGVKHFISLHLVLYLWIALAVCLQADTLAELVHIINVVHPFLVDHLQKDDTLQFTKLLRFRELCLFLLVELDCLFFEILF